MLIYKAQHREKCIVEEQKASLNMNHEIYCIPVFKFGRVVAWAVVDSDEYLYASQFKWKLHTRGYACRGRKSEILMHRELMGCRAGDGLNVDHVNRNKLDNRRSNLRLVNGQLQNLRNNSGRGYAFRKGKWQVELMFNYKHVYGGRFDTEAEAKQRVAELRQELYRRSSEQAPRD